MKRKLFSIFLPLLFLMPISFSYADEEQLYIVSFQHQIDSATLKEAGATLVDTVKSSPIAVIHANQQTLSNLEQAENIVAIEPNKTAEIAGQRMNWGIKPIQTPLSWSSGYTGKGVKIAIIDTGVGPHDDLTITEGISFIKSEDSSNDFNGHGTHVAGIIAATDNDIGVKGIAPNAEIYALKVFNKEGKGYTYDIIKAIDWAIENDIDIINMSLTSQVGLLAYENIINEAYNNNVLIVGAAGNSTASDPQIDTVEYPAKYESVIAVSSVDWDNNKGYYSSIGPAVEIAAPGVSIYSLYTDNSYTYLQGTSMATAFVTGQLALLKEAYPHLSNRQLRKKLIDDVYDLGPQGRDAIFGYGLLQARSYLSPLYHYTAAHNPAVSLSLSTNSLTGDVGETIKIDATAQLQNGEHIDISNFADWTLEDSTIASSRSGRIDFLREGKTTLIVQYDGLSKEASIETLPRSSSSNKDQFAFVDVRKDSWARDAIQAMYEKQIITGYADKTFKPNLPIQRQHVAAIIARTVNLPHQVAFQPFSDVSMQAPYYYEIMKMQQATIFTGYENQFKPNEHLTRAQMAKVIVETFQLPKAKTPHPFPDVDAEHWSNDYISSLYAAGITTGSDGLYKPNNLVTRTQFAGFLHRALSTGIK